MSDITKCQNYACPRNLECHRFTAPVNNFQSYQRFEFAVKNDKFECEFYIKN